MGVTIRKYFQSKKFRMHMREHNTTRYEQRAGSRYKSAELQVLSCVRGYHVCKDRWTAAVGELLTYSREPTNASIRYAVAGIKKGTTIGHLLWNNKNNKISMEKNLHTGIIFE